MTALILLVRLLLAITITDGDTGTFNDGPSPAGVSNISRTVSVTAASGSVATTTSSTADDYTPGPV